MMTKNTFRAEMAARTAPKSAKAPARHRNAMLLTGVSGLAALGFASPALALQTHSFDRLSTLAISADLTAPLTETGAAQPADLQVFGGDTGMRPVLSAGLVGSQDTVRRGATATFLGHTNYPAFVARSELRIFNGNASVSGTPLEVIATNADQVAHWTPGAEVANRAVYVFRVYDAQGNFDETAPQSLKVISAAQMLPAARAARPDFGLRDSAALRSIPLGQAHPVVVQGSSADADALVRVTGQIVPGDAAGQFVSHQLVPANCAGITVSITDSCGSANSTTVPRSVWQPQAANDTPVREGAVPIANTSAAAHSDGMRIQLDPVERVVTDNPYDIAVRTDTTHVDPVLAVGLATSERTVVRGAAATFVSYTNYPAFIARREVRIFRADVGSDSAPLAVVEADRDGVAHWTPGAELSGDLFYVYRVYDRNNRFDETAAQELTVLETPLDDDTPPQRPLFGTRDEAAVRNISFARSATVTVTGNADPALEMVRIAGQTIPLQVDGRFVSQQIVARDTRQVMVTVGRDEDVRFSAMRDIEVKNSDWFVVGQGDLTFVSNRGSGPAVEVSGDPLAAGDNVQSRAAFYARGTMANGWRVTAALDTGETLIEDLFSNIDRKDPRQLLRRMDSSQYYTTYGDDSTLVEDAPTQGRFYLRVQRDQTSLLVGNFVADIRQAELAQLNRGVFGAIVDHHSLAKTSFGESRVQFTAFASDPGSAPGRDEFRGTGGSLYYLKRRDLTVGSERLAVELRDRDTGLVLSRRELRPQEDYDIDYFQGRVTLLRPLSSSVADSSLVRDGSTGGNVPVLVANYEYTPAIGSLDGYTFGGRAAGWVGDTLRLGVTAQRETTADADQTLLGADATLRLHAGTYFKGEVAQSDGPGFGQGRSLDGGLSFADQAATGLRGQTARAWRAEVAADFAEMQGKTGDLGKLSAFYEHADAGFSGNGQLSERDRERWGVNLAAPLGDSTTVSGSFERLDNMGVGRRSVGTAEIAQQLGGGYKLSLGLRYDDRAVALGGLGAETGQRTDGAVQFSYAPDHANYSLYAFGQATLDRDATRRRNNRGGIGGKLELSDRDTFSAEASGGDGGLGANVELNHRYGNGSETYLGYALVTDRTDLGLDPSTSFGNTNRGTLTMGARHRFSTALSIHGENKIGHGGLAPSVMRSFGFDFAPSEHWSFAGTFENGHIDDEQTGLFRRTAATLGAAYSSEEVQFGTNVEGRFERGNNRDQTVWLFRNHASLRLNPNWTALGKLNFALADHETTDVRAADFVEGTVGFAYRPVLNDRLNLLARYTYLRDMGPIGQITQGGETASPKQRSQIFSIDGNFDLTNTVTIGAKYAFRQGSVSLGRESNTFVSSNTQLVVLRADWRAVREWDLLIEGHYLSNNLANDNRWGGVAALYRHINENVKIGAGYSFSDFSSDLGNQSYNSRGFFINLLGKF